VIGKCQILISESYRLFVYYTFLILCFNKVSSRLENTFYGSSSLKNYSTIDEYREGAIKLGLEKDEMKVSWLYYYFIRCFDFLFSNF
jgi:hypothetical protein